VAAKGPFGAAARQTRQLLRRIVNQAMTAKHVLNVAPAQAEIVQEALVEIGKAVRGKTIAQCDVKGSEPGDQTGETRGKRLARPVCGQFDVEVEDPIVRAHGVFLSAGTRRRTHLQVQTGDEVGVDDWPETGR
jgi:hypothetical protein